MTAILIAAALVAGLGQGGAVAADVHTIEMARMSGVDTAAQRVVRLPAEWELLWREHAPPGKPAPAVDFSTRMVLAVFLGSRPTGGYSVRIVGTRRDGDTLVVDWIEHAPNPRDVTAQILTSPAHIVDVPKHAGTIRFQQVQALP